MNLPARQEHDPWLWNGRLLVFLVRDCGLKVPLDLRPPEEFQKATRRIKRMRSQ